MKRVWRPFLLLSLLAGAIVLLLQPRTAAAEIDQLLLPAIDNEALLAEDAANYRPGVAPRYALPVAVKATPAERGVWASADGRATWTLRVTSPGAVSLSFGFDAYQMPEGGELWVRAVDGGHVRGPFTAADNETHGELWTPLLWGDDAVIEVTLPAGSADALDLSLGTVLHAYAQIGDVSRLLSGACNLDVVCGTADGFPQVEPWRDEIRSVAVISTGGGTFCTGFLVNNTAQDLRGYFMTADHCGIGPSNAPSLVAYWNYENSTCRQPDSAASGGPGDGTLDQFNTGAVFIAGYGPSDFTLVELDDPIDETYNVHYAGWDARDYAPDSAVAIHHPNTDEKRISFEDDPTFVSDYLGASPNPNGTHITVVDWDLGTTEPGSSGSPLFTPEGRVIGQLHGGYAACGNDLLDSYGRFYSSWSGGGSPGNRLAEWLDPVGGGTNTVLDGTDQLGYSLNVTPATANVCAPVNAVYTIDVVSQGGFNDPVTLGTDSGGSFSVNPVIPTGSSELTVAPGAPGSYAYQVTASGGGIDKAADITLNVFDGAPTAPTVDSPANGATGVELLPTVTWTPGAQNATFDVGISRNPSFTDLHDFALGIQDTSWTPGTPLEPLTTYYVAVRAKNPCGGAAVSIINSFTTSDIPSILLIDDDDNSPDVQAWWTTALANQGLDYDLWNTNNSDNEPDAAQMLQYEMIIWMTGDEFGGAAGPSAASEGNLATFLDGSGLCLLMSSQDYLWDRGGSGSDIPTSFMTNYLGMASGTSDVSQTALTGALPLFPNFGTSFPYTNWSDVINPNASANVMYVGNQGNAAIYKLQPGYSTVYMGIGMEALTPVATAEDFLGFMVNACVGSAMTGVDLFAQGVVR